MSEMSWTTFQNDSQEHVILPAGLHPVGADQAPDYL